MASLPAGCERQTAWRGHEPQSRIDTPLKCGDPHYSNCTPQHKDFNRNKALWAGLEDSILNGATTARRRITVFNGPVFTEDDPTVRHVKIPLAFWKVGVFAGDDQPSATAYLIS